MDLPTPITPTMNKCVYPLLFCPLFGAIYNIIIITVVFQTQFMVRSRINLLDLSHFVACKTQFMSLQCLYAMLRSMVSVLTSLSHGFTLCPHVTSGSFSKAKHPIIPHV